MAAEELEGDSDGVDVDERIDRAYVRGMEGVWRSLVQQGIANIGPSPVRDLGALHAERHDAVRALREVCALLGDNDWEDDLHLGDIIEKHVLPHIEDR
jgi:hypothetical protein